MLFTVFIQYIFDNPINSFQIETLEQESCIYKIYDELISENALRNSKFKVPKVGLKTLIKSKKDIKPSIHLLSLNHNWFNSDIWRGELALFNIVETQSNEIKETGDGLHIYSIIVYYAGGNYSFEEKGYLPEEAFTTFLSKLKNAVDLPPIGLPFDQNRFDRYKSQLEKITAQNKILKIPGIGPKTINKSLLAFKHGQIEVSPSPNLHHVWQIILEWRGKPAFVYLVQAPDSPSNPER